MGEDQPNNNAGRAVERVTIAEAAALLGCHPNTVRSRVKAGMYRAEKFHTENGPTWMIERDSLTNNVPTSASQQAVSGVPASQQKAIQELARAIVREAVVVQDPEAQARLEGNKMRLETAKTQILIGSGSFVGLAAVVGIMPDASLKSPLLYLAFAFVFYSILAGRVWMLEIAKVTASSEGEALGRAGRDAAISLGFGLMTFVLYIYFNLNTPGLGGRRLKPLEGLIGGAVILLVGVLTGAVFRWHERRRAHKSESSSSRSS